MKKDTITNIQINTIITAINSIRNDGGFFISIPINKKANEKAIKNFLEKRGYSVSISYEEKIWFIVSWAI